MGIADVRALVARGGAWTRARGAPGRAAASRSSNGLERLELDLDQLDASSASASLSATTIATGCPA